MTASLLGLGALVMASAELFTVLKWAGAGLNGAILVFSFYGVLEVRDLRASNRGTCRSRQ